MLPKPFEEIPDKRNTINSSGHVLCHLFGRHNPVTKRRIKVSPFCVLYLFLGFPHQLFVFLRGDLTGCKSILQLSNIRFKVSDILFI